MSLIEIDNVSRYYNENSKNQFLALDNVNLRVEKGEMIAIKGSSGAGKSTLLHIIGLLDDATSGKYIYDGIDVASMSLATKAEYRNQKIGFILQDFGLLHNYSVFDSVAMPIVFSKVFEKNEKTKVLDILDSMGMERYADKMIRELSGGEKQRVAIARALINSPELLLCDEPTGSLDEENAGIVMDILKEQNSRGMTIVLVTHDSEIAAKCQKIYQMRYGQLFIND